MKYTFDLIIPFDLTSGVTSLTIVYAWEVAIKCYTVHDQNTQFPVLTVPRITEDVHSFTAWKYNWIFK